MIPGGVPAVRELAPRPGLSGMQTGGTDGFRTSWTRLPPLIFSSMICDQPRRQGMMDPVRYARRTGGAAIAIQGDPVRGR